MQIKEEAGTLLAEVRERSPLIHNITNYVTVNDCANAVLAIGASPIMADDINEAGEVASVSAALVINIGTLNHRTIDSMILAGKRANRAGVPVVLDPVGAGASVLRNETTEMLLGEVKFSVVRGNLSEIAFVAGMETETKGVDSAVKSRDGLDVLAAKKAAQRCGCVAAVTGEVDVITDGNRTVKIYNGHPMLSRVTGTGCMTTALTGAFAGAASQAGADYFTAAAAAVAAMGIAGEIAWERAGHLGTGSFRVALMDALSVMDEKTMKEMARFEEV